jgi:hypothetical protein
MLLPPLAVLIAVAASNIGATSAPPPPVEVCEEPEVPVTGIVSRGSETTPGESAAPIPRAPDLRAAVPEESAEVRSARALVFTLTFRSDSAGSPFPSLEADEAARLMTRHPETAEVFVEALDGASRKLRTWLAHTFYRVEDRVLQKRLLSVHQQTDPTARRMKEILADRGAILAVLRGEADAELLHDLLGRIGSPLIEEPEIKEALLSLVRNAPNPDIRNRALSRVGRQDDPQIRALLIATLSDPLRDTKERQTAARVLMWRPGADTTPVFVSILNRDEPAPLMRFAALGLKKHAAEPEAAEALFGVLLAETADTTARKNAATALSHTVRKAGEDGAHALEGRLRSALTDLSRQDGSEAVLAHAMGEMSRGQHGRFDQDVVGILRERPEEERRILLIADPTLKRTMEEL